MFAYCGNNPVNRLDSTGTYYAVVTAQKDTSGSASSGVVYPYIHSQSEEGIGTKKFGVTTVSFSGCGAVAIYNALITLGARKPLDEILEYFNESASRTVLWGALGTLPHQVEAYFVNEGYRVITTNDPDGIDIYSKTADASIMWYRYPYKIWIFDLFGAHFTHYAKSAQGYVAYNDDWSQHFPYPSDFGEDGSRYGSIGIFIYK